MTSRRDFLRAAGGATLLVAGTPNLRLLDRVAGVPRRGGGASGGGDGGPGPATTAFMDPLWDESLGLIRSPFEEGPPRVRETSWYALGLLQRDGPGDRERAQTALATVVGRQYDSPGSLFHGSYPRFAEDPPLPPPDAVEFAHFDPNWRQFIGTALAMAALRYGDELGSLTPALEASVELAGTSERPDRVQAGYTNIALMHAWLLAQVGARREGDALAKAIAERYRDAGVLDEYNAPTYDGVSLYALGLWRREPPSPVFATLGEELETGLWRTIARTYHPGLGNVCGPYLRAAGMSLDEYASLVGLWIWAAVGEQGATFPDLSQPFGHSADVCFGPLVGLLPPEPPRRVRAALEDFDRPRTVRAEQPGAWEATSWLGRDVMIGAHTGDQLVNGANQLYPATVHWADGWILVQGMDGNDYVDAVASKRRLELTVVDPGPAVVTIGVPGLDPAAVTATAWELPGLHVDVQSDVPPSVAAHAAEEGVELEYPPTTLRLDVTVV